MPTKTAGLIGVLAIAVMVSALALVGVATGKLTDPTDPVQIHGQVTTSEGERGPEGAQGAFTVSIFQCAATSPSRPSGGSYQLDTGVILNRPSSWVNLAQTAPCANTVYISQSGVNPALADGSDSAVPLQWSSPVAFGGSGMGALLPAGSNAEPRLRWNATTASWDAVGESTWALGLLVQGVDFATLQPALEYYLGPVYKFFYPVENNADCTVFENYSFYRYFSIGAAMRHTPDRCTVNNVWTPGLANPPYMVVVAPTWTGWIDNYRFKFHVADTGSVDLASVAALTGVTVDKETIRLAGEAFDIAYVQLPAGSRPTNTQYAWAAWEWVAPAVDTTVEDIP